MRLRPSWKSRARASPEKVSAGLGVPRSPYLPPGIGKDRVPQGRKGSGALPRRIKDQPTSIQRNTHLLS